MENFDELNECLSMKKNWLFSGEILKVKVWFMIVFFFENGQTFLFFGQI